MSATELVQNGGFETGNLSYWSSTAGGNSNYLVVKFSGYVHSGSYGAQLYGDYSLSQNLPTAPGQSYLISFWLSHPLGGNFGDTGTFTVQWGSDTVFIEETTVWNFGWTNLQFVVTATGANTALTFGYIEDLVGFALDDVSVTPITTVPPGNDNFANAWPITLPFYETNATNLGATREAGEPDNGAPVPDGSGGTFDPGGEGRASVWWKVTVPGDGTLTLTALSTNMTPMMAAYQGTSLSHLTPVANSTVVYGPGGYSGYNYVASRFRFNVISNTTYFIAVDGFSQSSGNFDFQSQFYPAPTNEYFAARTILPPDFTSVYGYNAGARLEAHEPAHSGPGAANSVWWTWTAPRTGPVALTTGGSGFNTILDVYTNSSLTILGLVAGNDDEYVFYAYPDTGTGPASDPISRVTFNAVAGTTYQICVSGANGDAGISTESIVLNNVTVALDSFETNVFALMPDGSEEFSNTLHITNLRTNATGPLRVRLLAQPGYSYEQYLANDLEFLSDLNAPGELLGVTNLPGAGTLGVAGSAQLSVSGLCPPPILSSNQTAYSMASYEIFPVPGPEDSFGIGYSVLAVLEEQVGGVWQPQDSRLIFTGNWPAIGGFQGPGGGVITIASSAASSQTSPAFLTVNLGPPAAVRMGGAWRVSPTNDGTAGELRFFTNYMTNATLTLAVQSPSFSLETKPLPGFVSPSFPPFSLTPETLTVLNLFYAVAPPRLVFDRASGLGIIGTGGTSYRIQMSTDPAGRWSDLITNTLAAGTNWISNTTLGTSSRFYRAIWLSN